MLLLDEGKIRSFDLIRRIHYETIWWTRNGLINSLVLFKATSALDAESEGEKRV